MLRAPERPYKGQFANPRSYQSDTVCAPPVAVQCDRCDVLYSNIVDNSVDNSVSTYCMDRQHCIKHCI